MSVLIKGIDMPKDCDECPMRQINLAYCQLMHESTSHYLSGKEIHGRPNFCPLVEIPTPHGRLIEEHYFGELQAKQPEGVFIMYRSADKDTDRFILEAEE